MTYLLFLQNIRLLFAGVFDDFFLAVTNLATPLVTFLLLSAIYWCVDKRLGQLMAMNVSLASWLNQWLKLILRVDRPWIRDTRLTPVEEALEGAGGYSMPSGHTTRAMATWGSFISCRKKRGVQLLGLLTVLLVAFSRNYLGVHTLWDVLLAILLGVIMLFLSASLLRLMESRDILVCVILCIIFFLPMVRFGCLSNAGTSMGFLIGMVFERRLVSFTTEVSMEQKISRLVIGLLVVFFCYTSGTAVLSHLLPEKYAGFFLNGFAAFFIIFLYPLLFNIWEKRGGLRKIIAGGLAILLALCFVALGYVSGGVEDTSEQTSADIASSDVAYGAIDGDSITDADFLTPAYFTAQNATTLDTPVKIIAHRGYSGIAPENTLAAFERAIDIGADLVEMDVQMTKDGQLVIFHDTDLARITGVIGEVSDYTLGELKTMDAGSYFSAAGTGMSENGVNESYASEKIPTLLEVLELIKESDLEIYLELKDITEASSLTEDQKAAFADMVVEQVEECGMADRVIYASFNYDYLKQIKSGDDSRRILVNTSLGDGQTLLSNYPADYYGLNIDTMEQNTIEVLHEAGKIAYVFTTNTPAQMRYAISLGADGLTTNYPGMAKVLSFDDYSYLADAYLGTFTVPALYDYNLIQNYQHYIMQGLTKAGDYIVISAYDYSNERSSILYILTSSGVLTNVIDLGFSAHTGGIAYDEAHDLLWITGADARIYAISWSSVISGTYVGDASSILYDYDTNLTKPDGGRAASFLAIDDGMLYFGTYVNGDNGTLHANTIEDIMASNGTYLTPELTYTIPEHIQGVTFRHLSSGKTMILTQGHEMDDAALLTVAIEDGRTDYSTVDTTVLLPEGAEQPLMTASGLYILFESSGRDYRATSRVPNDQVWLINVNE